MSVFTHAVLAAALAVPAAAADWSARLLEHGLVERSSSTWTAAEDRSWSANATRRLTASRGAARMRVSSEPAADEAAARRAIGLRRARFLAQFDGDIGYPGMVTRGFHVPEDFRPREAQAGPDGGHSWLVAATERLTYGVGAADLMRYVAAISQRWCPGSARVVELELFFPKESFAPEAALAELAAFSCAAPAKSAPLDRLAAGMAAADKRAKEGDYAGAVDLSSSAVEEAWKVLGSKDESVRAAGLLAEWARFAGRAGTVKDALRRLESVRPPTTASLIASARILRVNGDADAAADRAEKAAESGQELALQELAQCRAGQGRRDDAIAVTRRGLAAFPRSVILRVTLAGLLRRDPAKFEEGMSLFAEARKLDPRLANAYIGEGYGRLSKGQWAEAEKVFTAAVAASSSSPVAHHHRGAALWKMGRREEGLAEMRKAERLFNADFRAKRDDYAHTLIWMSGMLGELRLPGAEEAAERALYVSLPGSSRYYSAAASVARFQSGRGSDDAARATIKGALDACAVWKCPKVDEGELWSKRSDIELAGGDVESARSSAQRAWTLAVSTGADAGRFSSRIAILRACSRIFHELGDEASARKALLAAEPWARKALLAAEPYAFGADVGLDQIKLYRRDRDELDRARPEPRGLEEGLAAAARLAAAGAYASASDLAAPLIDAAWESGHGERAVLAVADRAGWDRLAGRPADVLKALKRLEAVRPPTTASLLARARIMRLDGNAAEAAALAETAAASGSEGAFLELALCRETQGMIDAAVAALRRGLSALPRSAELRVKLADLLRRTAGFEEAARLTAEARELAPDPASASITQGYARLEAGDWEKASAIFQAAVDASTASAGTHHHRGAALWRHGDLTEGLAEMETALRLHEAGPGSPRSEYAHTLSWLISMRTQLGNAGIEELLRKLLEVSSPDSAVRYDAYGRLSELAASRGEHAAARALSEEALDFCARRGCPPLMEAFLWASRSTTERAANDPKAARKAVDRARALARSPRTEPFSNTEALYGARVTILGKCAGAYRALGDEAAAQAAIADSIPLEAVLKALPASKSARATGARGLILISVDALRADRVGALRGEKALTPGLDALARGAVVFTQAVSQAPWTLPSMGSVFTSMPPSRHGLTNRFASFAETSRELARLPPSASTLAEAFKRAGFETAAFTGDAGLDKVHGFDRGFDVYFDSTPFAGFDTTMPMALSWLETRGEKPFFLFVHGYDVHGQHRLPAGFQSRFADPRYRGPYAGTGDEFLALRRAVVDGAPRPMTAGDRAFWTAQYDERVARADLRLKSFLDALSAAPGLSTGVVIAVMADHGDELFERGGVDHGMTLYDEALRVPLIVRAPGFAPRRVDKQVRLLDLAPTLLDLLGVADPAFTAQAKGSSLRPLMEGRPDAERDALSETDFLFRASKRSLRGAEGRKLIFDLETLRREVYDLKADPGETRDLAPKDPGGAAELERRLRVQLGLPAEEASKR